MCWKLHLCTLLLVVIYVESFRLNSIVRLSCDKCLNADKCCLATLIAQGVAISTKYCAESCQFVIHNGKLPIISTFTHSRVNTFAQIAKNRKPNDIALIIFNSAKHLNVQILSAIEPMTLVGLKAYVPTLNAKKPYLISTVILPCSEQFETSRGYLICTNKHFGQRMRYGKTQGLPLLLNDKILGISGYDVNHQTQEAFMAAGPLLAWIRMVIEQNNTFQSKRRFRAEIMALKSNNDVVNSNFNHTNSTKDLFKNKSTGHFVTNVTNNPTTQSKNKTMITKVILPSDHNFDKALSGTTTNINTNHDFQTGNKTQPNSTVKITDSNNSSYPTTKFVFKMHVNTTTKENFTYSSTTTSKAKKYVTNSSTTASITSNSTNALNSTTIISISTVKTPLSTTTANATTPSAVSLISLKMYSFLRTRKPLTYTNVMDWFKMMKKDIMKNSPSILILTTTAKPIQKKPDSNGFVDLTL